MLEKRYLTQGTKMREEPMKNGLIDLSRAIARTNNAPSNKLNFRLKF